jgi:tetratricopeptide (TPR) repeat protein
VILANAIPPAPAHAQAPPSSTEHNGDTDTAPSNQRRQPRDKTQAPETGPHAGSPAKPGDTAGDDTAGAKAKAAADPLKRPLPETAEQRTRMLEDLYALLATAEDEQAATPLTQAIARIWLHSGSDTIDALMKRALASVQAKKYPLARRLLDAVVEIAPDYAEGWSSRGHVHYLENDVERALGDLRRAIALDPNHFKALDGLGTIFREIGQKRAALKAYEQLLSVHPYWSGARQAHDDLKRDVDGQGI